MVLNLILLAVGLLGLFFGGEWLIKGASRLARSFGVSALIVGLTVVSFGTSLPELIVSLNAALRGSSDIAIGNVVGSNIANIGLILGVTGLIYPIVVRRSLLQRDMPIMLGVMFISYLMILDGEISRIDGGLLFLGLLMFMGLMVLIAWRENHKPLSATEQAALEAEEGPAIKKSQRGREVVRLVAGLAVLVIGARLTVDNAIDIARIIGVSELVIGITLVALGTSLPELAASGIAAMRHQSDIAIGNVLGSNIFNVLSILGITALVKPITVNPRIIDFDGLIMLGFGLLLIPFVWNRHINRIEAGILLVAYIAFIVATVVL